MLNKFNELKNIAIDKSRDLQQKSLDSFNELTKELINKVKTEKISATNISQNKNQVIIKDNEISLSNSIMMQALDWAYNSATGENVPGMSSCVELAEEFLKYQGSINDKCNKLINWQLAKAGGVGFCTNFGGMITWSISIPANISILLYIQLRMIGAIAHMGGYDIKSEQVKTSMYLCLLGHNATKVLEQVGSKIAMKLTSSAIKQIPVKLLTKINQAVGFRLVTKMGRTGIVKLSTIGPIVGGVVGGAIDVLATNTVALTAKAIFLEEEIEKEKLAELEKLRIEVLMNMMKIDGVIKDQEISLLEEIIDTSGIMEDEKILFKQRFKDKRLVDADLSVFKVNETYSIALLDSLLAVMASDGEISPGERLYLQKIAKDLNISQQYVGDCICNSRSI